MHFEDLPAFRMAGNFKKLFAELKLEKVFTTFSKLDAFEENSALSHQNANFCFCKFHKLFAYFIPAHFVRGLSILAIFYKFNFGPF